LKISSIRAAGIRHVYDLCVPKTHNFIAENIVVHNSGAQSFIKEFKPNSVMDIAVATAIYRPGPLTSGVDKLYIESRNNPDDIHYAHPLVKEVLEPYYGTIIFQETMMKVVNIVGGFSLDQTDSVRKALMKRSLTSKDETAVKQQQLGEKFVEGAMKNGLKKQDAVELWEKLHRFSGYAFNACCTYDTEVCTYTKEGFLCQTKKIMNVNSEEYVKSRDEKTKKTIFVKVKRNHHNGVKKVVRVRLKTGEETCCTMDHKFRTTDGQMLSLRQILKEKKSISTFVEDVTSDIEQKDVFQNISKNAEFSKK
jgi:hypothetical protein